MRDTMSCAKIVIICNTMQHPVSVLQPIFTYLFINIKLLTKYIFFSQIQLWLLQQPNAQMYLFDNDNKNMSSITELTLRNVRNSRCSINYSFYGIHIVSKQQQQTQNTAHS